MKSTVLIAGIAAGFTLLAFDASAAGRGGSQQMPDFATLDVDQSGGLSLEEIQNAGAVRFAAMDTDGNGSISAAEMVAAQQGQMAARAEKMIAHLDENDDGELQADEMKQRGGDRSERMFERVDADENGEISAEEFEAAAEKRGGRGGKGHRGRG